MRKLRYWAQFLQNLCFSAQCQLLQLIHDLKYLKNRILCRLIFFSQDLPKSFLVHFCILVLSLTWAGGYVVFKKPDGIRLNQTMLLSGQKKKRRKRRRSVWSCVSLMLSIEPVHTKLLIKNEGFQLEELYSKYYQHLHHFQDWTPKSRFRKSWPCCCQKPDWEKRKEGDDFFYKIATSSAHSHPICR